LLALLPWLGAAAAVVAVLVVAAAGLAVGAVGGVMTR